jgi:hypothetical protein
MGVFFTPSFVLLPLSPAVGVIEVFKIIAIFGKLLTQKVIIWLTGWSYRLLHHDGPCSLDHP